VIGPLPPQELAILSEIKTADAYVRTHRFDTLVDDEE
jgi:hypothetical protein